MEAVEEISTHYHYTVLFIIIAQFQMKLIVKYSLFSN